MYLETDWFFSTYLPKYLNIDFLHVNVCLRMTPGAHTQPNLSLTPAPNHISEAFSSCKLLISCKEEANDIVMQLFWINEDFFTASVMQDEAAWMHYALPNFSNVVAELF